MPNTPPLLSDVNVHLDGTKLSGAARGALSAVHVFQTRNGASAFELVVADPQLDWADDPTFTDCKEVTIELGVPGKMKKVFDGEVTAWRHELERKGPTVLVVRGLDRSHRLMRAQKTRTYASATPLDCARKIAQDAGLTAKCAAGQPAPINTYRTQANETDFSFLRKLADLEGYLFYIEGSELHFERPTLSSTDDVELTYGEDLKTFLPVANFRKPATQVETSGWDEAGKAPLVGTAAAGSELWSVPGGKPGAQLAKFQQTKPKVALAHAEIRTQAHADTIAKAALTMRNLEFLTAEVEAKGNPDIKPGAMVGIKKVGIYSGHYWVTEANHFWDAAGYSTIFYVARDTWGPPPQAQQKPKPQAARAPTAQTTSTSDSFFGIIEGTYGPLKTWPFRLLRNGKPVTPSNQGLMQTSNKFEDGAWLSDNDGKFRFDKVVSGELVVVIVAPGGELELPGKAEEESKAFDGSEQVDSGRPVLAGALEGTYGNLVHWPFRLLRGDRPVGPDDLGDATTDNEFADGAWLSDDAGRYRFEGLSDADYEIDIIAPSDDVGEDANASEGDKTSDGGESQE